MSERLAVFYDERVLEFDTGEGFFDAEASPYLVHREVHAENGLRLANMASVLREGPISTALDWHCAEPASREDFERFHSPSYVGELASIPSRESRVMTVTTVFAANGFELCRVAAGQAIAAAEFARSQNRPAYALVRPPGHHAQPAMADGYCFINNIGVAIERLREQGLKRAAVIDWDTHHGNGTQEGFYRDADILTISLHMPHGAWGDTHPQSGNLDERGEGAGRGANLNLPLPYGSGDIAYTRVFDEIVAPAIRAHAPEVLFIACGQDANQFDPNGRQLLSMAGFHALGRRAGALADECCGGRLVLIQEGGYQLSYAAYCLHATLEGVLGRAAELEDPIAFYPEVTDGLDAFIENARRVLAD